MTDKITFDRRLMLQASAAGALMLSQGAAWAKPADDLKAIRKSVEAGHAASVTRIQEWIRNPSIAAENLKMREGAEYMARLALDAGFQNAEVISTDGHPGVFATMDNGAKEWMGIYFMYDVKQYDSAEWTSPPLEARILDKANFGKVIMGRGAVNQKGPEAAFLAALHAFRAAKKQIPVNLVLVAEGEEEIASPHFYQIVQHPKVMPALAKCMGVIIPSASQSAQGSVVINLGAKGAVELEVVASSAKWGRGPEKDLHSSQKARVDSPAWRLVAALQTLVTPDGNTPAIEGWFEKVRPLTARERELVAEVAGDAAHIAQNEADAKATLGVNKWIDDLDYRASIERLVSQPTVNIQGLVAGYTGPGGKTILPNRAVAKIDLRLVPNMTREDCAKKIRAHLDKKGFPDVEVNISGGYDPTETAEDSRVIRAQLAVFKAAKIPASLYPRSPGSWPGAVFTGPPLKLPAGQFGLGYGQGAHAPDEFFLIESSNPKLAGLNEATMGYAEFLYQMATLK